MKRWSVGVRVSGPADSRHAVDTALTLHQEFVRFRGCWLKPLQAARGTNDLLVEPHQRLASDVGDVRAQGAWPAWLPPPCKAGRGPTNPQMNDPRSRSSSRGRGHSPSCSTCAPDTQRGREDGSPILRERNELVAKLNRPAHCVMAHHERAWVTAQKRHPFVTAGIYRML